jgi:DNA-directed RNA polymerase subunit RPC12/RpoP
LSMVSDWELANLTNENGDLGRPVPSGHVRIPDEIRLDPASEFLTYDPGGFELRPFTPMALNGFLALNQKPIRAVERYAREWGVLQLRPPTRVEQWRLRYDEDELRTLLRKKPCEPASGWLLPGLEPVIAWHYYSLRACAILNIAASVKNSPSGWGAPADWAVVGWEPDRCGLTDEELQGHRWGLGAWPPPREHPRRPVIRGSLHDQAQRIIEGEVGNWLRRGRVSFGIGVDGSRGWQIGVNYSNGCLFSAIALQLALTVAGAASLYFCSNCSNPYIRPRTQRRPKAGQSNFCPDCGRPAARRLADQRRREKMAKACRLHSKGMEIDEIAEKLSTNPATVSGWIKKG